MKSKEELFIYVYDNATRACLLADDCEVNPARLVSDRGLVVSSSYPQVSLGLPFHCPSCGQDPSLNLRQKPLATPNWENLSKSLKSLTQSP